MSLLDYFKKRSNTANTVKNRLEIIIAHDRAVSRGQPSYLPALQQELLEVIQKYIAVGQDAISVNLEQNDNQEILELNIALPDETKKQEPKIPVKLKKSRRNKKR